MFQAAATKSILYRIHVNRDAAWRYEDALGVCCRRYAGSADRSRSVAYRLWVLDEWRRLHWRATARWVASPIRANLLCIHHGEGAWNAIDPSGTYYGGLQMDLSFQAAYGARWYRILGTADHWTPLEQLTAGARAVRSGRGYYPWPTTARVCGLI